MNRRIAILPVRISVWARMAEAKTCLPKHSVSDSTAHGSTTGCSRSGMSATIGRSCGRIQWFGGKQRVSSAWPHKPPMPMRTVVARAQ